MKPISLFVGLACLVVSTVVNADWVPASLIGKAAIPSFQKEIEVQVSTKSVTTGALRAGFVCRKGTGKIREVSVRSAGQWLKLAKSSNGRYELPFGDTQPVEEVLVRVTKYGLLGGGGTNCLLSVYDADDKSFQSDGFPQGAVNFVAINNGNVQGVKGCLARQAQIVISGLGISSGTVSLGGPLSQPVGPQTNEVDFLIQASDPFGDTKSFYLILFPYAGASWRYSQSSVTIGGITYTNWQYETPAMNRLGYILAADGSGQPLFRVEAGPCWGG